MAKAKKEFTEEEKWALGARGIVPGLWELVYRYPSSIAIRNTNGDVRLVDMAPNGKIPN